MINDTLKEGSAHAIRELKELGVEKTVMLTGDRREVGEDVAHKLGLDECRAELLPTDKVSHVEQLLKTKPADKTLAYVGDGINDAPVLKRADVGIAMGGLGSDAAIEAADVVLMDDDEKSRNTARPVLLTPKPLSQRSLAAREATSRGTRLPNAG